MTSPKPFVFAVIGAVLAAVFVVWLLEPHVDRLSVTLGVGFSEGAATPETTRFADDLERLRAVDRSVFFLLLVILAGGLPLAVIAALAHVWPWLFGPLIRNGTLLWLCLTMQMTNVMLPSFFILLFASEGPDVQTLTAIGVAITYAVPNLLAAGVWRELINRLHLSQLAQVTGLPHPKS